MAGRTMRGALISGILGIIFVPGVRSDAAVTFQWATVGNPGNAADPSTSYGSVGYTYQISKYETTNAQYTEFLNAVDATGANTRALYNPYMSNYSSTPAYTGGIDYTAGNAVGSKYTFKSGQSNKPVIWVSWYDAARMANWLHNGQGTGDTESGVYTLTGNTSISGGRSVGATFVIPTENEWYKAAYHQPTAAGGDTDAYWLYPTGTNTEINSDQPPGDGSINTNAGNFYRDDGIVNGFNDGYAVTGSTSFSSTQNYLTNVGAYTTADSFYGTFDQGGNVWEWNETLIGSSRGLRGGSWGNSSGNLRSGYRNDSDPAYEYFAIGFRLASIPEPSSVVMGLGLAVVTLMRRRARS